MTVHSDEHERSVAFAEIALGQIRALRLSATPRDYEIWYTYATGYNPSLNQTINELLIRKGTLAPSDIDQIYDTFIFPVRLTERIDDVGSRVADEIDQVMAMVGAAVGSARLSE
jgi:diguanylate cyclase